MSKSSQHNFVCPWCKHKQTVTVWESINVTLDPDLRVKLFEGKINVFKCDSCGKETFISIPLMYHDMTKKFCVQYYPPEYLEIEEFYENFDPKGHFLFEGIPKKILEIGEYIMKPHIVFSIEEMILYIIFRETLYQRYFENK